MYFILFSFNLQIIKYDAIANLNDWNLIMDVLIFNRKKEHIPMKLKCQYQFVYDLK